MAENARLVSIVESHSRPTIMDGEVVTFSTSFKEEKGIFGPYFVADGAFSVSASRNCVLVHRCELRTEEDRDQFTHAVELAYRKFESLRGHRG